MFACIVLQTRKNEWNFNFLGTITSSWHSCIFMILSISIRKQFWFWFVFIQNEIICLAKPAAISVRYILHEAQPTIYLQIFLKKRHELLMWHYRGYFWEEMVSINPSRNFSIWAEILPFFAFSAIILTILIIEGISNNWVRKVELRISNYRQNV